MLFNLSSCRHYPSRNESGAIFCGTKLGPCFDGGSDSELSADEDPFNMVGNCSSNGNKPGYEIPVDGAGINMLTNYKDGNFTISDLEVWEVKNLE